MTTLIPLDECPGLIDLMLTGEKRGSSFRIGRVECFIERIGDKARFEAVAPDFGIMLIFPGWYVGEHGLPARVFMLGDTTECLRWLPIPQREKWALIARLPLCATERALLTLAV